MLVTLAAPADAMSAPISGWEVCQHELFELFHRRLCLSSHNASHTLRRLTRNFIIMSPFIGITVTVDPLVWVTDNDPASDFSNDPTELAPSASGILSTVLTRYG